MNTSTQNTVNGIRRVKTSFDISDALLAEARVYAKRHKTTVKALVERGLRQTMNESTKPKVKFQPVVVNGGAVKPEMQNPNWSKIREEDYEDSGR